MELQPLLVLFEVGKRGEHCFDTAAHRAMLLLLQPAGGDVGGPGGNETELSPPKEAAEKTGHQELIL